MAVYEKFGLIMAADPTLLEVEPTRLIRLLPIINTPEQVEEAVHFAATSNAQDFDNHLRMITGKQPTDDGHEHEYEPWLKCRTCNKFIKEAV
jgi:hypothetical protein